MKSYDLRYVDYEPDMSRNWTCETLYEVFLIVADYAADILNDNDMIDFDGPEAIQLIDAIKAKDYAKTIEAYNNLAHCGYFHVYEDEIVETMDDKDPYQDILDRIKRARKTWEEWKKEEAEEVC